ncbi:hypothetical protein J5X84_34175 [Streptosporangiaceae bacterium NEAU-GS5]|nr:hypothetical protein [Streptosporangiaceae bacterium NEAU-GS5]
MRKRTSIRLGTAAILIVTAALQAPPAVADIGGGLPGITENGSDPMVTKCTFNGQSGFCMVTSQDIGSGSTPAVPYPMNITKGYFSTDGLNWVDEGRVVAPHTNRSIFEEEKLFTSQPNGFVPAGTNHLWAPDLVPGPNGTWRLYEPDIADNSEAGSHVSSRIMMSTSNSPFGPFTTQHVVTFAEGAAQYASDPEVAADGASKAMFWVNGDLQSCGEFMSAPLADDGFSISGRDTFAVQIDGIPSFYGSCHRANTAFPYAADYPYMEGPSVFKTADLAPDLTGLPGPFIMLIPMKPSGNPPECQVFGQPGGNLSVIAYATAPNLRGPYTYQRILMCGSSTEWTNQAYLAEVTTSTGKKRIALYYHDGTPVNGNPMRKIHAECLWYGGGTFAMATRTTTGFQDCMAGADANTWAFRKSVPNTTVVSADQNNNKVLTATRASVGPWEKFGVFTLNHAQLNPNTTTTTQNVNITANVNGLFVSAENAGTANLVANRTAAGPWESFSLRFNTDSTVSLISNQSGKGVTSPSNSALVPNTTAANAEHYIVLHL